MRVRSNILTSGDVYDAAHRAREVNGADVYIDAIRDFKPRREAHGVEFWAYSLNGKVASAHRPIGSYSLDEVPRAASWTDYGYLIAHLFNKDPHAQIGHYDNEADFVEKVRSYVPRGQNTDFLHVLTSIDEYPDEGGAHDDYVKTLAWLDEQKATT
jgi:hypothetical protein